MNDKYRPAFTIAEIEYLIALCNADLRPEVVEMSVEISNRLKVFLLKANLGLLNPAFTSAPKVSITEKLGLDSPEEKRLMAHRKWCVNKNICTPDEIKLVHAYRYENNLMTKEEEKEYEKI